MEKEISRKAIYKMAADFFNQPSNDVSNLRVVDPIIECTNSSKLTISQVLFRSTGILVASVGVFVGLSMIIGGRRKN